MASSSAERSQPVEHFIAHNPRHARGILGQRGAVNAVHSDDGAIALGFDGGALVPGCFVGARCFNVAMEHFPMAQLRLLLRLRKPVS